MNSGGSKARFSCRSLFVPDTIFFGGPTATDLTLPWLIVLKCGQLCPTKAPSKPHFLSGMVLGKLVTEQNDLE